MVRMTKEIVDIANRPVTVKTRLGWDDNTKNIGEVAERLQDIGIAALSIHGRTRAQLYKGPADWTLIGEVRNNPRITIPIFGNGDVDTPEKALEMKNRYGVDGVMIGRASIGYPWIFNEIKHYMKTGQHLPKPTMADRLTVCKMHLLKSIEWKGEKLGIIEMRRHYTNYFRGLPNFKEYRMKLVTNYSYNEILNILAEVESVYANTDLDLVAA
jgi:nifR3 family TIM-barrel protein